MLRIVQPIDMVDPQAGRYPSLKQTEDQPVRLSEDRFLFGPDGGQFIDVEKSPIIDLLRRHTPGREPVTLFVQQSVEFVEACRQTFRAVIGRHVGQDMRMHFPAIHDHRSQPSPDNFCFPIALGDFFRNTFPARRQMRQRGQNALQFEDGCMP